MQERGEVVERLREFLRLNYMTGAEAARRMGVRDSTLYSWLQGESKPASPERIFAKAHQIGLKILSKPTEEDWKGHFQVRSSASRRRHL